MPGFGKVPVIFNKRMGKTLNVPQSRCGRGAQPFGLPLHSKSP